MNMNPDDIKFTGEEHVIRGDRDDTKQIRILNLHGYHGSPQNAAFGAMEYNKCETVVTPQIDYDSESPERIIERLSYYISDKSINLIVGTSLGGFYASVLAAKFDLPVILINPCLLPFLHLPRLGYNGDIKEYISLFGTLSDLNEENVSCIVGDADEVIDSHDFTERMFSNERFRHVPGGKHSGATLPLNDYFAEVLPYCGEFLYKKRSNEDDDDE